MAKIQIFFSADLQGEYVLDDKYEVTVGRDASCDIVISNFAVSRHHCTIRDVKKKWTLFDENSSNGTFVNGEKVVEHVLNHKDRVVLGKHTLLFDQFGTGSELHNKLEQTSDGAPDGTMFVSPGALAKILERSKQQQSMGLMLNGSKRRVLRLTQPVTIIGKGPRCDLRIQGLFVKPEQAIITQTEFGHKIRHTGGLRQMRINGDKREEVILSAGDVITLAGNKIAYGSL